jgi:transposase
VEEGAMEIVHPVCCGIDVHAAQLTACVRRVGAAGQIRTELVEYGTTSRELLAFRRWLHEQGCPVVALESTGVSWQPVSHGLIEEVDGHLAHSRDGRQRPGKQTDKRDATWIAELLAHGLITPSCVPPPTIRA